MMRKDLKMALFLGTFASIMLLSAIPLSYGFENADGVRTYIDFQNWWFRTDAFLKNHLKADVSASGSYNVVDSYIDFYYRGGTEYEWLSSGNTQYLVDLNYEYTLIQKCWGYLEHDGVSYYIQSKAYVDEDRTTWGTYSLGGFEDLIFHNYYCYMKVW